MKKIDFIVIGVLAILLIIGIVVYLMQPDDTPTYGWTIPPGGSAGGTADAVTADAVTADAVTADAVTADEGTGGGGDNVPLTGTTPPPSGSWSSLQNCVKRQGATAANALVLPQTFVGAFSSVMNKLPGTIYTGGAVATAAEMANRSCLLSLPGGANLDMMLERVPHCTAPDTTNTGTPNRAFLFKPNPNDISQWKWVCVNPGVPTAEAAWAAQRGPTVNTAYVTPITV